MSSVQIKEGDVVVLESGGPSMTVISIESGGYLLCKWFDEAGKVSSQTFPASALRKIPEYSEGTGVVDIDAFK
jgi:uncharacterized protein YodC (DUF2158 family)